jgi:hypothetical protein
MKQAVKTVDTINKIASLSNFSKISIFYKTYGTKGTEPKQQNEKKVTIPFIIGFSSHGNNYNSSTIIVSTQKSLCFSRIFTIVYASSGSKPFYCMYIYNISYFSSSGLFSTSHISRSLSFLWNSISLLVDKKSPNAILKPSPIKFDTPNAIITIKGN